MSNRTFLQVAVLILIAAAALWLVLALGRPRPAAPDVQASGSETSSLKAMEADALANDSEGNVIALAQNLGNADGE